MSIFDYEGDKLSIKTLDECVRDQRLDDKLIIQNNNNAFPTVKEANMNTNDDDEEDSLEMHKANFNNFKKKESYPACGRYHGGDPDRCERRGEKFQPDWMNKRIRQCNLQHRDAPKKPQKCGLPQPMDLKINPDNPTSKEAELEEDLEELDQGDMELTNMFACIKTMDDDFLHTGSVEIKEYENENNKEETYEFLDDPNFIKAPGLQ